MSYYGGYYGYYGSVRVPDPLPSEAWTCPECGEHRSITDHGAREKIARWKRDHKRDHHLETLTPEQQEAQMAEWAEEARVEAKIEREAFKREMEMWTRVYAPRSEKPKPEPKRPWYRRLFGGRK